MFNTGSVSSTKLREITLGGLFSTKNATDISGMFAHNTDLNLIHYHDKLDVQNVKNMNYLFYATNKIENINLSKWYAQSVESMEGAFATDWTCNQSTRNSCDEIINLENFNFKKVKNFNNAFSPGAKIYLGYFGPSTAHLTDADTEGTYYRT